MATTTSSTYMSLPVPVVGTDPGPQYATDINSCLTLIDAHDHTVGSGVQITPAGLNINSQLTYNNNHAIAFKSVRFSAQVAPLAGPADLGCLYESGVDLYYNDGSGNQIRITQSGGITGTSGSIANLTSPASAIYVSGSQTFVWQSAANTPANMDGGSFIFRNITASSNGITVSAPAALASNYTITWPTLPASTLPLTITSAGNIGSGQITTAQITDLAVTNAKVAANAITTAKILDGEITTAKLANMGVGTSVGPGGFCISGSSGSFNTGSGSFVDVTNLSVVLGTAGRPVRVQLQPDGGGAQASLTVGRTSGGADAQGQIKILRDSTVIFWCFLRVNALGASSEFINIPPSAVNCLDADLTGLAAGSYTYKVQVAVDTAATSFTVDNCRLYAYEI